MNEMFKVPPLTKEQAERVQKQFDKDMERVREEIKTNYIPKDRVREQIKALEELQKNQRPVYFLSLKKIRQQMIDLLKYLIGE